VSEMGPALAEAAGDLVVLHPLRAYDAVQLASALLAQSDLARVEAPALTFLTADDRLLVIAEAEGLRTDNPNRHP
jgi:predicted nucleic acid-binding protein